MTEKNSKNFVAKISVSIKARQKRSIDDLLKLDRAPYTKTSQIIQAALDDWLEKNTEKYTVAEDGQVVTKTRFKGMGVIEEEDYSEEDYDWSSYDLD